jgi:hypothetical protein|tara:strand:+ start:12897 stop:13142 length:246 start_codon:yes stop_codon:yes gene_type:complete
MLIARDYILCSLLTAQEKDGFMQNLDPPHLVYVKHDDNADIYDYLNLEAGKVVYTKRNHDSYTKTISNMFIIPIAEVVGVE